MSARSPGGVPDDVESRRTAITKTIKSAALVSQIVALKGSAWTWDLSNEFDGAKFIVTSSSGGPKKVILKCDDDVPKQCHRPLREYASGLRRNMNSVTRRHIFFRHEISVASNPDCYEFTLLRIQAVTNHKAKFSKSQISKKLSWWLSRINTRRSTDNDGMIAQQGGIFITERNQQKACQRAGFEKPSVSSLEYAEQSAPD
jgi:hypothetical protein